MAGGWASTALMAAMLPIQLWSLRIIEAGAVILALSDRQNMSKPNSKVWRLKLLRRFNNNYLAIDRPNIMEQIIIRPTGEVPFKFFGSITEEWGSQYIQGREQTRWHEIALYSIDDSDVEILQISYETRWAGETGYIETHHIQDELTIATLLQLYDPLAYLVGYPDGEAFAAKRADLNRRITSAWNEIKAEVYESLEIAVPLSIRSSAESTASLGSDWPKPIPLALHRAVLNESNQRKMTASAFVGEVLLPFYRDTYWDLLPEAKG